MRTYVNLGTSYLFSNISCGACEYNGKIYIYSIYAGFLEYDINSGAWRSLATSTYEEVRVRLIGYNGFIYKTVGGGSTKFEKYDIQNNQWTTLNNTPYGINTSLYFTVDKNLLYLVTTGIYCYLP